MVALGKKINTGSMVDTLPGPKDITSMSLVWKKTVIKKEQQCFYISGDRMFQFYLSNSVTSIVVAKFVKTVNLF